MGKQASLDRKDQEKSKVAIQYGFCMWVGRLIVGEWKKLKQYLK